MMTATFFLLPRFKFFTTGTGNKIVMKSDARASAAVLNAAALTSIHFPSKSLFQKLAMGVHWKMQSVMETIVERVTKTMSAHVK